MLVCQECDCFPQYGSSCTQHDGLYEQPNLGAAISLNLQNTQSLRRCCNLQQSIQDKNWVLCRTGICMHVTWSQIC